MQVQGSGGLRAQFLEMALSQSDCANSIKHIGPCSNIEGSFFLGDWCTRPCQFGPKRLTGGNFVLDGGVGYHLGIVHVTAKAPTEEFSDGSRLQDQLSPFCAIGPSKAFVRVNLQVKHLAKV